MRTLRHLGGGLVRGGLGLIVLCLLASSGPAQAAGDAKKGRQIAIDHCSRCHVIPDYNRYGGIDSTPSFKIMAQLDDYLDRFQTFYARRPHPVVVRMQGVPPPTEDPAFIATFKITPEQIDDIVAYVKSIRAKP